MPANFPNHTNALVVMEYGKKKPARESGPAKNPVDGDAYPSRPSGVGTGALSEKTAEERVGVKWQRHAGRLTSGRNAGFPALDRHIRNASVLALQRRQ
jgi:hypothetical protein